MHFTNNNKTHAQRVPLFQRMILLIGLCLSFVANAEQPPLKFQQLSVKQGLSQSTVYSIAQDKHGLIWLATQDGLNLYDGYEFKHYRNDSENPNSLANNIVRKVFVDSRNMLWIGTDNGLSLYNSDNDSFTNFYSEDGNPSTLKDNTIWNIFEDRNNNLWVATALGLHRFNFTTNLFEQVNLRSFSNNIKPIKTLFHDHNGNYWLGTFESGLYILHKDQNYISPVNGENIWQLNIDAQSILAISEHQGKYWVATDNGIYIVNHDYKLEKHIEPAKHTLLADTNRVRSVYPLDDRFVWIGTEAGLLELDLVTNQLDYKKSSVNGKRVRDDSFIYNIFVDNSDTVWISTYYEGIRKYNSISSLFTHHLASATSDEQYIKAFTESDDGTIWIASEQDGIYTLGANSSDVRLVDLPFELKISSLHAEDNSIWIITDTEELYHFDTVNNLLIEHPDWLKDYQDKHGRLDYIFSKGSFYFGSSNSALHKYDPQTETLTKFYLDESVSLDLYTLNLGNDGNIWTFTDDQRLYLFDITSNEFNPIKLPEHSALKDNSITVIQENDEFLWLGFWGKGLLAYNKADKQLLEYNKARGLADDHIAGLLLDESGKAWVSTNKGISSVDPDTMLIENYGVSQGIQSEDFFSFSYLKASDGKLYFGGANGFNGFYPYDIKLEPEVINAPLNTKLLIANEVVAREQINFFADQPQQLYLSKGLTLDYHQSPFSIEFASPNSTFPKEVKYRYKLEGIDDNWVYTDSINKRATYTKLDPGSYEFNVQAFSPNSEDFKSAQTITVTIMPPWWFTSWAWAAYGFLLLSIVFYFYRQAKQKQLVNYQIKESEERLKLALWGSGDEMWDWNIKTGQMFRSNIWGILDFPQDGHRNKQETPTNGNIHPQDSARVNQALDDHFSEKTDHFEAAYRVKNKEGKWTWVLDRGKVVERDINNAPSRMTGTIKDISKIKQTEESLKLFAKCIANISDAVVVYDEEFYTVDCNPSFQRITGQTRSEAIGSPLEFKSYPNSFLQNLKKNLKHHGSWQGEIESKRLNGQRYLVDITMDVIRDENQKITHYVGVFSDITKRKETEKELRKLANTDTLTGLPNRSYFQTNHTILVNQETVHALLVFDLDNFKKINDSLGHQIGDVLLCKVTERIATVGNLKDTCYRLGGDEFSLIIEGTNDLHEITTIADEILKAVAEPYNIRNQEIALSCSIGIALFPEDGKNSHELLKNADTAMYHAKDKGGDCYQFFNDSMNTQAVKRLQIENLIRHGLKEDLFSVFYQPKINITTGKVSGMEALVRFEAGVKGIIRPDIFIPISEETGQIIEIGENVLRKACQATKVWVDKGVFDGRIAVNLSAVQFRQPNLVSMIESILAETRLPAQYLELEITEGTVMNSPQEAIDTMHRLRSMGISLSLDDFGTGYSSLAYLKKFPLNTLKIDKAFVDDIEASEQGKNMVATIITIAHNLGLDVVAEGVENQNQLDYLKSKNCEQLQGYLYSKPLSQEDFGRYLLSHIITRESTPYSAE